MDADKTLEGEVLTAEEESLLRQAMTTEEESAAILPMFYSRAVHALTEADRLDECRDYIGKAELIGVYAKQAKDDRMLVMAKRINGRAWRRLGELLHAMPRGIRPGTGRELQADKWAQQIMPALTREYQFARDIAKKVGLEEGSVRRTLTMLSNAGITESRPNTGFRLRAYVEPDKVAPETFTQIVLAGRDQRNAERRNPIPQPPRELTLRGTAEREGITKGEQSKAMRIAELPTDIFESIIESPQAASGHQLLRLRRDLVGSASSAYGLGRSNMRRIIEREVAEFRRFTDTHAVAPIARAYGGERSSMCAKLDRLIWWSSTLESALRARK